jgi:hypothetical protein
VIERKPVEQLSQNSIQLCMGHDYKVILNALATAFAYHMPQGYHSKDYKQITDLFVKQMPTAAEAWATAFEDKRPKAELKNLFVGGTQIK